MSDVNNRNPGFEDLQRRSLRHEHRQGDGDERPGARGLSQAARGRRTEGQAAQRNRRGHQDLHQGRGILAFGQATRRGPADQDGQGLSRSLGPGGAPHGRRTGRRPRSSRRRATSASRTRSGNRTSSSISCCSSICSPRNGRRPGEERRRHRSAHPQEGRVLRPADHQRDRAVEFRSHQSGSAARDAGLERRQPRARHEDAGRGHRGRPRHAAHPPVRPGEPRRRRQHGDDAGQGDLPERADAADPVHADHRRRCCARRS